MLTYVGGGHVLRVLSKNTQKGGGPCPQGALKNYSNTWGSSPCPWGRILISLSSRTPLTPIPLSSHFRHVTQVRWCKISSINCSTIAHAKLPFIQIMNLNQHLQHLAIAHRRQASAREIKTTSNNGNNNKKKGSVCRFSGWPTAYFCLTHRY
jgi:hypothetical protein